MTDESDFIGRCATNVERSKKFKLIYILIQLAEIYGVGRVKTNKYKYKLFYKQSFCKQQQAEIGKN